MEFTSKQLEQAIIFASEKHQGQVRKGDKRPYILHPMSVMLKIQEVKKSSNIFLIMAVCILHDTVEDCGVTLKEIAERFGYQVAALVDELTLDKTKYATIGKKEYLAQHVTTMSSYALAIKLADRLDNVSDLKSMDKKWALDYIEETNYVLSKLTQSNRKLTKTHNRLITMIYKTINLYQDENIL